jgi:hypothetical protein
MVKSRPKAEPLIKNDTARMSHGPETITCRHDWQQLAERQAGTHQSCLRQDT